MPKDNVDHPINGQGTAVSTFDLSATTPRANRVKLAVIWKGLMSIHSMTGIIKKVLIRLYLDNTIKVNQNISHPTSQSLSQPERQPVSQLVSQHVSQPNQSVGQPASQWASQSACQTVNQSSSQPASQLISQPVSLLNSCSVNQPFI